ncbi:MAG TPA: tRNA (adenosine(37)-N6)-threonylcarbamoyltransferase complex dimerization subunit type 1 TsaB [Bacillota bacterium]|nr:tRNA (adenosine(37)-N6)-threonylcarbamoyltransferase complex dimerization subunit type 1 TsaB [Bacillota bacterium]
MKVLGIDTATPLGVVGFIEDERAVLESRISIRPGGGERLPALIADLLKALQWKPNDLDLIVAGIGPGSYTGIRVGLALARSMAFALSRPLVGIPTQEAIAAIGDQGEGITVVLADARRGETYTTMTKYRPESNILFGPGILPVDEVIERLNDLNEPVLLLGDGTRIYREQLATRLKIPVRWGNAEMDSPSGVILAQLGLKKWLNASKDELDSIEPLYLRKVEAEVRLMERRKMTT